MSDTASIREQLDETKKLLEKEREKLRVIVSGISDGVIAVDLKHNVISFNKRAEEITGYGISEAIDKNLGSLIKVFDGDEKISLDTYCPSSGIDVDAEVFNQTGLKIIGKDGLVSTVNLSSRKIREGTTVNLGCILTLEDTAKETELERMKLDFVSLSAHELRTPLSSVRGYLSYLNQPETMQKLSEEEQSYINIANDASNKLRDTVENILVLAEINKGKLRIDPVPTKLEEVVLSVINELKPRAELKDIKINLLTPPHPLPLVIAEIGKIKDVVENLIINAVKFTDEGYVEVSFIEKTDFIETIIRDTGRGIPTLLLPHLFEKFFRVKERALVMEVEHGLGIGLFISKYIIERHRGEIWVESEEGKGSTFHFTLPISKI